MAMLHYEVRCSSPQIVAYKILLLLGYAFLSLRHIFINNGTREWLYGYARLSNRSALKAGANKTPKVEGLEDKASPKLVH